MVECTLSLSLVFASLSDDIRRDILSRVSKTKLTVGQIAGFYTISLAAVAKHISVLERAALVRKERRGKEQLVSAIPETLKTATVYLSQYEALWNTRFQSIDVILEEDS